MKKPFKAVFGIFVFPDLSESEAGRASLPRVNHSKVDFPRLLKALEALFPQGPRLRMLVPNDTIDQVTMRARAVAITEMPAAACKGSPMCEDFGELFIKAANASKGGQATVIDVREAWSSHHSLPDRDFAPPPTVLPFLVETLDFPDAMIWMSTARISLGLGSLEFLLSEEAPSDEVSWEGKLPESFRAELEAIFGCPYESSAILMRLALSSVPAYVSRQSKFEGR